MILNTEFICKIGSREQGRVIVTDHVQTVDAGTPDIQHLQRGWTVDLLSPKNECVNQSFQDKSLGSGGTNKQGLATYPGLPTKDTSNSDERGRQER